MNTYWMKQCSLYRLLGAVVASLVIGSLGGCDVQNQGASSSTTTSVSPPAPIRSVTINVEKESTTPTAQIATPPPSISTLASPEPTPTWMLGMLQCNSEGERAYIYLSCWRGIVNGRMVTVAAGGEHIRTIEPYGGQGTVVVGDSSVGVIMIARGPYTPMSRLSGVQIYHTPDQLGDVHIVSVAGTQLSIAPNQPNSQVMWIFDVATRQFVSPSGTPIPTTPVPVP